MRRTILDICFEMEQFKFGDAFSRINKIYFFFFFFLDNLLVNITGEKDGMT